MEVIVTKKVQVSQYAAFCEKCADGTWNECIVVYDADGKEVARSGSCHPEGFKSFIWNGFEFIYPHGYGGEKKERCYVRLTDKVFLEKPE
jgi:hypothetical protein